MKCLYYLAPTLASTSEISEDLHEVGLKDFFLHVTSKDEYGLKKQQVHSGNYLERLDLIRDGLIGAAVGVVVGLAGLGLLAYYQPFGPDVPTFVYFAILALATLFGAWEGGLVGVDSENKKLKPFHDDIEAGKYLLMLYVPKIRETAVREMMRARHPEARLEAVDTHFINPFSKITRASGTSSSGA